MRVIMMRDIHVRVDMFDSIWSSRINLMCELRIITNKQRVTKCYIVVLNKLKCILQSLDWPEVDKNNLHP